MDPISVELMTQNDRWPDQAPMSLGDARVTKSEYLRDRVPNIVSAVVICLIVLTTVKLEITVPLSYIDEGYNLALAKHFAFSGQYATEVIGAPLRWFDPKVSTGPVALVPLALTIRLLGLSLLAIRVEALGFFLVFLASVYFAARQMFSPVAAAVTISLIGASASDLYDLGLRILGEIPALTCLNLAFGCLTRRGWRWSLAGGAWVGLALQAKPQMAIAAVAIAYLGLLVGWVGEIRDGKETTGLLAGLGLPVLVWNAYEAMTVGMAGWLRLTDSDLQLAFQGSGLGHLLSVKEQSVAALGLTLVVLFGLKAGCCHVRRLRGLSVPWLLAVSGVVTLLIGPLMFVKWYSVAPRLLEQLSVYPVETIVSVSGAFTVLALSIRSKAYVPLMLSVVAILFAEWYFGLTAEWRNDLTPGFAYRYSIYYRVIGLICAGVSLKGLWWLVSSKTYRSLNAHGQRDAHFQYHGSRGYAFLAVLSLGAVAVHSLSAMLVPADQSNVGAQSVARWIERNTPGNAIIVGSGWWMPWESADLSNRDIADAYSSALEVPKDLMRRRYLVMPTRFLHSVDLHPDVVDVMGRPDLLLYQAGGYGVYRWPESVDLKRLKSVVSLSEDLLQLVNTGRVAFAPEPRSHALDPQHGNFWYPVVQRMLRGMYVISPAEMTVRNVSVGPSQILLLGYVPPVAGDGLSLRVFVVCDGRARLVYYQYVRAGPSAADDYRIAEIPLGTSAGRSIDLTVRVSSDPSGDSTSDWLFVGPLAIVSSTR